ncbi:glycoside hydrolase family 2 protein [Actinoplanes sp. NPDC089786]|uniref:glycoside hydrolase family 2 protein n=1 Tax=Actinoplanes sp. NPDC089786 TaxID=3155185 RepID=UPI0034392414
MIRDDLHAGWTVVAADDSIGPLTAEVPGSIHTDLLAAGLIDDPYAGANEAALTWLHRSSWIYRTTLPAVAPAADERVDLVFDGLDTVATITLGGAELGHTANMHRSFRFDVRDKVNTDQELGVRFDSALAYAEAMRERLGARPAAYEHPYNMIRKMACSFGWDWGPDLQTCGIWKPVRLERWRVARLASVRPLATLDPDDTTGRLTVHASIERSGLQPAGDLVLRVSVAGRVAETRIAAGSDAAVVELAVEDAAIWWPVGYGDQPLNDVTIELLDGDARLDVAERRVGFRRVELDETPDEIGQRFAIVVNGREIWALGLNWIPEDHLLTRLTRERYAAAVDRAVLAHANLLRVWGGGIYESDDFYDLCDERGVLVWQDFPLACAAYPEEEPIRGEILAEARENIARLSPHPSLAIWNGGNENLWGHEDWNWKLELGDRTWGLGYYQRDFPALLAEIDPTRPYHPGSPSSPGHDPADVHPNDDRYGTRHEWESWNQRDYTWHDRNVPRFCAEFGWQAPPAWATLTEWLDPADLRKDSPAFLLHQKAADGNGKLDRGLAHHLGIPARFDDWHWATQLNQARATTYAVEHLRAHRPRTMGSVLWQLNDCWPVTSWAVVDSAGRLKPSWYALRRAYAPRLLTIRPLSVVAVNDSDAPWSGTLLVRRLAFDGTVLASVSLPASVAARSVATLPLDPSVTTPGSPAAEVVVAELDGVRAFRTFVEDQTLAYDPSALTATVAPAPGGYAVTVAASSFARDVTLLADRVAADAAVDEQLVTLLPGESFTFRVRTAQDIDPTALLGPSVLRSAVVDADPAAGSGPEHRPAGA